MKGERRRGSLRRTGRAAFLALAAILAIGGSGRAQTEPEPLTLGEAVERALRHDPALGAARAAADAARAGEGQASAAWWPELGLSASLTRYQEPTVVGPIHGFEPGAAPSFDRTPLQAGTHVSWTVFDGGGREATVRRARLEAAAASEELNARAQALVTEVAAAYLQAESRARVLAAHDRRIAALESELDRVGQLREAGRAAEIEVLRVEAALAAAGADRIGVRAELGIARREVARLMGAPPEEPERRGLTSITVVEDRLLKREELVARSVEASPELEAARRRRTAAEAGASLARSSRWPALEAFGSWIDYTGLESDHQLEWAAGVRVSVPLFTGGRIDRGVDRAEAELRGAHERVRVAELGIERAVDRAVSNIEETAARVRSLETAAARSAEVVRIERLRIETGTGTQTDYLDAEADLLSVEAALAEARHAWVLSRVELARTLGILGPAWLEANVEVER